MNCIDKPTLEDTLEKFFTIIFDFNGKINNDFAGKRINDFAGKRNIDFARKIIIGFAGIFIIIDFAGKNIIDFAGIIIDLGRVLQLWQRLLRVTLAE